MNKPLNKMAVQATINGESTAFLCSPGQVLAEVLRDELELIGTKIGCNTGDCGACSVLVDDRLVCSCLVLAAEVEGKSVQTVEGVANGGELHPVQQKLWSTAACSAASARRAWWLLPRRCWNITPTPPRSRRVTGWPVISAAAPATTKLFARYWMPPRRCARRQHERLSGIQNHWLAACARPTVSTRSLAARATVLTSTCRVRYTAM